MRAPSTSLTASCRLGAQRILGSGAPTWRPMWPRRSETPSPAPAPREERAECLLHAPVQLWRRSRPCRSARRAGVRTGSSRISSSTVRAGGEELAASSSSGSSGKPGSAACTGWPQDVWPQAEALEEVIPLRSLDEHFQAPLVQEEEVADSRVLAPFLRSSFGWPDRVGQPGRAALRRSASGSSPCRRRRPRARRASEGPGRGS